MKNILIPFILGFFIISCSGESNTTNKELLPLSVGAPGEMIICMDSVQWHGKLGEKVKEIFLAEVQGIPREETLFTVRYIKPEDLSSTLRQIANLIYITSFDSQTKGARKIQGYFTPESRQKIMSSKDYFLSTAEDLYARDQQVMYLFGQTEADLIRNLDKNSTLITDHFNREERKRIAKDIFKTREKGIEKTLKNEFGLIAKIPSGYEVALINERFIWLRQMDKEIDKSIIISYTEYEDFEQFEQYQIIARRDSLCKQYLYGDKENNPDSYMITETDIPFIPVISRQINLNNVYAVETRGLWRTNSQSMGGPFLGVTLAEEGNNRLFYIEGFVFSPGKPQREIMRELEAVLYSFKFIK